MRGAVLVLAALVVLAGCGTPESAQDVPAATADAFADAVGDCPRGQVNDPAPGLCGAYVDQNKDGLCDRSQ
jgi:hypothetical protein